MTRPFARLTAFAPGIVALAALSGGQVIADDGEIIILRQVSPRPAARHPGSLEAQGPIRAKVDTSPDDIVEASLGLDAHAGGTVGKQLAEGDYSSIVTRHTSAAGGTLGGDCCFECFVAGARFILHQQPSLRISYIQRTLNLSAFWSMTALYTLIVPHR